MLCMSTTQAVLFYICKIKKKREKSITFFSWFQDLFPYKITTLEVEVPLHCYAHLFWWLLFSWIAVLKSMQCPIVNAALQMKKFNTKPWLTWWKKGEAWAIKWLNSSPRLLCQLAPGHLARDICPVSSVLWPFTPSVQWRFAFVFLNLCGKESSF